MAIRKIKKSWWVDIRHNHIRYRKRSPDNSKVGTQAYEAVLRQKLARGETLAFTEPGRKPDNQEQKFKKFAWQWFETYVKTNNKFSEVNNKKYVLKTNLIPFFGETSIDKIDTMQVELYKSRKIGEGLMNKTINNHLIVLGKCLRDAQEWLNLPKIPKIKKLKIPPFKIEFLLQEESNLLLANSNGIWHDIIFMALQTGLRRGELKALNWLDIDWNNKMLIVRHSWCEVNNSLDTPKSNRDRHIPLTNGIYDMLWQRKKNSGFVFVDKKGNKFDTKRLNQEIGEACIRAGIRKITCHTLRHTFASHLVMAGASLKAIQELLGHANIQITMRYAHLTPSSLREAITLLDYKKGHSA
ncbi:MAG: tyrosine-type recombinase/integrase [bacterium]|nr:tyrosine-type recombinase/integrase [bacterium]